MLPSESVLRQRAAEEDGTVTDTSRSTRRPVKTALHQAVLDGRLQQVRILVEKHGVNVDSRDLYGRTPIMLSCLLENINHGLKMAKLFLRAGAYPNIKDKMGRTVLSYACMKGREEIVARLLKEDVLELNNADNDGNTALIHAAVAGHPDIVSRLVDQYVRFSMPVDSRNHLRYTALLLACKYGHYVSAHTLLKKGSASPALRDSEFYLNAAEWTKKSDDLQASYSKQRSLTLPSIPQTPSLPSFTRESTMYGSVVEPTCYHNKPNYDPLGLSLERLPTLFKEEFSKTPNLSGLSNKQLLLKEIEKVMTQPKPIPIAAPMSRPFSTSTTFSYHQRNSTRVNSGVSQSRAESSIPPPLRPLSREITTPDLLAYTSRGRRRRIMDNLYIFRLYSEQYDPYLAGQDGKSDGLSDVVKKRTITIQSPAQAERI